MDLKQKHRLRQKRIWRIRRRIKGTTQRPRLCLTLTGKHLYAQAIDDVAGKTLVGLSSQSKELEGDALRPNLEGAKTMGQRFGEKAVAAGLTSVIFDRHGRPYHGRVQAFAEAAREAGLKF